MKHLWVIVLNWNGANLTNSCIDSLALVNSKSFKTHILVVDNGSTDDSIKTINKHLGLVKFAKNITHELIETGSNEGYAGGNNVGCRYALEHGADYLIVLNNDTLVDKHFADKLVKSYIQNNQRAIICPKIYFAPGYEYKTYMKSEIGKVIWSVGGKIDWKNIYGTNRGVDQIDQGQFDREEEVDFASGACFLVGREIVAQVGLFDESYFMYLEDLDYCHRVQMADLKVIYTPRSKIWHKVAQSSAIGGDLNDYFITRNRLLFGYRYASLRTKLALFRESIKFLITGRQWQRLGSIDYYIGHLGRGRWR